MQNLSVTALICNHNYGKWIGDAIKSVVAQSYPLKQICVVDDRSTDGSVDIVLNMMEDRVESSGTMDSLEYKIHTGKIDGVQTIFVVNPHSVKSGPSFARNLGSKIVNTICPTDIIAVLDADDYWLPGKIEACLSVFLSYPHDVTAVYTDYCSVDEDGGRIYEYKEPYSVTRLQQECIVHSGCFIRTEALVKVGGWNESLRVAEDYELWAKLSRLGIIYHIPKSLSVVRQHASNSTNTVPKEVWQYCWQHVKKVLEGAV